MIGRQKLLTYLNELLQPETYRDYCPNGLQVEGKKDIHTIITGVTACQALIDQAIDEKADALLVHHGFFWKGEPAEITGIKKNRISALLKHHINLIAYHLPLDGHLDYGNNTQLGVLLGFDNAREVPSSAGKNILMQGALPNPSTPEAFAQLLENKLDRKPLHIIADKPEIKTIAWCTGGADKLIAEAKAAGVDAFISGEISEPTTHFAREANIHYFAAGHHATERYGVKALGEHLANVFPVNVSFVDIDNPV